MIKWHITIRKTLLLILFYSTHTHTTNLCYPVIPRTLQTPVLYASAGIAALVGCYATCSVGAALYYRCTYNRYANELFIWKQNQDDVDTAHAELVRHVLKNYIRSRWFDNSYTNYPFAEYVRQLESTICWLRYCTLFKTTAAIQTGIEKLIEDLSTIKAVILTFPSDQEQHDSCLLSADATDNTL